MSTSEQHPINAETFATSEQARKISDIIDFLITQRAVSGFHYRELVDQFPPALMTAFPPLAEELNNDGSHPTPEPKHYVFTHRIVAEDSDKDSLDESAKIVNRCCIELMRYQKFEVDDPDEVIGNIGATHSVYNILVDTDEVSGESVYSIEHAMVYNESTVSAIDTPGLMEEQIPIAISHGEADSLYDYLLDIASEGSFDGLQAPIVSA